MYIFQPFFENINSKIKFQQQKKKAYSCDTSFQCQTRNIYLIKCNWLSSNSHDETATLVSRHQQQDVDFSINMGIQFKIINMLIRYFAK